MSPYPASEETSAGRKKRGQHRGYQAAVERRKFVMSTAILFALIVAFMFVTACGGGKDASVPKDIPVATIFYQWFGYEHNAEKGWPATGGLGTFHWNDIINDQLITGFVANEPEIGYYASDADDTIAWQLQKMEDAGIDTIIVSWWAGEMPTWMAPMTGTSNSGPMTPSSACWIMSRRRIWTSRLP